MFIVFCIIPNLWNLKLSSHLTIPCGWPPNSGPTVQILLHHTTFFAYFGSFDCFWDCIFKYPNRVCLLLDIRKLFQEVDCKVYSAWYIAKLSLNHIWTWWSKCLQPAKPGKVNYVDSSERTYLTALCLFSPAEIDNYR